MAENVAQVGEDLESLAANAGLTPEQVVEIHTGSEYRVYAIGFAPGFAYLVQDRALDVPPSGVVERDGDLQVPCAIRGDPALGLYFDCCARGAALFGVPGLESGYLEQSLGGTPLAGMFGSCEIGPIGGDAELLTYTGVLALLDA